ARRFARRHARAGGTAHRYVIRWSAPGSPFGAAHTVDLPLLFGDAEAWRGAGLLAGADWEGIQRDARRVRQVWGDFARGRIPSRQLIPRVLELRRAGG
ncbi:carboxylesterase/lipase family protein, partial [Clavibacter californiensis]